MEGQVVGERYRLTRRLGRGGFGTVYEAEHVELGSKVAVKVLDTSRCTEASIARFLREAEVLSQLTHPAAVRVFDRGRRDDGTLWIAMELLTGESLEARLGRGVLFPGELVELFRPLCEVLAEAHGKGIVHRDLKPGNVMLAPLSDGRVAPRLFDFGIAGLRGDSGITDPDLVSGTPRYMAPEQWEGLGLTSDRSDVYSLGVIAYECLSGRLPVEAEGALAWLNQHRYGAPRPLREALAGRPVPPGIDRAIARALDRDPDARQASALDFWRELEAGIEAGIADEPPPPRVARRSLLRWGLAALALPALGGGALWLRSRRSTKRAVTCPALAGPYMPLAIGHQWRYRVLDPASRRPQAEEKTIRIDQVADIGGLKAGTTGFRLARQDASGSAYRWLARSGDAVVWHRDDWFDRDGVRTRSVFYEPWRLRVDDACAHRTAGARWSCEYERVDLGVEDASQMKRAAQREEWLVEAIDEEIVVPAGTFRCLRLRRYRVGDAGERFSWYWFAAGVGKIREDSPPEELEELTAFQLAPS